MEDLKYLKEYFEPHFNNILEKLREIKTDIDRLYDNHQNNNDRITVIEERLKSGVSTFDFIRKDIKELKKDTDKIAGMAVREKILWSAVGILTSAIGLFILSKIFSLL